MFRMSHSFLVFLAIVGCVSAVEFTTYTDIPTPFQAYGKLDFSHYITLDNYDNSNKDHHYYYVANNIPAQKNELLYQFACLFDVNSAVVTGSNGVVPTLIFHVVRPLGEGIQFVHSLTFENVESGKPIDVSPLRIELQTGDMIVFSSPNDSIKFRVGIQNIGYPIPYGVSQVAAAQVPFVGLDSPRFIGSYQNSTNTHGVTLLPGQFLQLCAMYGTFGKYNNVKDENVFLYVPRDIVRTGDGGKVIKEFRVGISKKEGGANYTGFATIEISVAQLNTFTYLHANGSTVTETAFQYDATRTRTFTGVQHNTLYVIPDFDFVTVQEGEMIGFRIISPSATPLPSTKIVAQWTHDETPGSIDEVYLTFPSDPLSSGAPQGTLLVFEPTFDTPNFVFKLGNKSPSNIRGDPQFAGFHGQSYQFHGLADEMFNLISTPSMQLNSHFVYLSSGKCGYNNTVCFQHPGTYVDALGFTIQAAQGEIQVKMVAGSHDKGLRVWMGAVGTDLHEVRLGAHPTGLRWSMENSTTSVAELRYTVFGEATIRTPLFDIRVVNSDYFFNLEISMLDQRALRIGAPKHTITDRTICHQDANGQAPVDTQIHQVHRHGAVEAALMKKYKSDFPMHGLIGQTWRNVMVCGKHWMGAVNDYLVSSLFATDYYFNYYTKRA